MAKLKGLVSKVVVDSREPSEYANQVIMSCKQAIIVQKRWKKFIIHKVGV